MKDLVSKFDNNPFKIKEPKTGQIVIFKPFHNKQDYKVGDEYKIEVIKGQYWGSNGLSNFWYWYRLDDNNNKIKKECGYGNFYKLEEK